MFSQTILLGRLGFDPEIRTTSSGKKVANLRLATTSFSKGKQFTEWHQIVAWGDGLAGLIEKKLHKGDAILVTGETRTRSYEKNGETRYSTEVVMGPNDTLRFVSVKGAKDDEVGHAPEQVEEPAF